MLVRGFSPSWLYHIYGLSLVDAIQFVGSPFSFICLHNQTPPKNEEDAITRNNKRPIQISTLYTTTMKAFYTKHSDTNFPHIMYVLETRWRHHPLFTRDLSQVVFQYTLFDKKEHTVRAVSAAGNLFVLKYLVEEQKVKVHVWGEEALRRAAAYGHLHVVKYLVEEQGANVHEWEEGALRWAARHGHLDVVKYLMEEHGANVHANNDEAVRWAAEKGHVDVVKYLVEEHGANVHEWEEGALRWAAEEGHWDVVKYLVEEHGADVLLLRTQSDEQQDMNIHM